MSADDPFDLEWTPAAVAYARAELYRTLTTPPGAWPTVWASKLAEGSQWVPPDAADVPADELAAWLTRQQAERIARARLFFLDPSAGDLGIQLGADIVNGHAPTQPGPPTAYGLLVCPSGIGYSADGSTLIAVNWGPLNGGGWWVSWWAAMREYVEWAETENINPPVSRANMARTMGLLQYITCGQTHFEQLEPADPIPDKRLRVTSAPHPLLPDDGGDSPSVAGAAATMLGAWQLLSRDTTIDLARISPPPEQTERDRAVGILPSKITRGYLSRTPDADRLWDYDAGPVS